MKTIFNYITTNLINGKQYIGVHATNNINDNYLGSGVLLLKAFKKYGKENFKREILCFCDDNHIGHNNEGIFIRKHNTLNPSGYNLSPKGGVGGAESVSDETKNKIRKARIGKSSGMLGKKHSEKSKQQISKSNIGKKHTEKIKKQIVRSSSKLWDEKLGIKEANLLKLKYAEKFKGNKISFKNIDLSLAEKLLKEGKHFKVVANILKISTTTFNYKFREIYNMTPHEYSKNLKNS